MSRTPARILTLLVLLLSGGCAAPEQADAPAASDVPVVVAPLRKATLRVYVVGYGVVAPQPAHDGQPAAAARLAAPAPGIVTAALRGEGDHVDKGDVLFRLEARAALAQVDKATRDLAFAEQAFERQEKLVKSEGTSQKLFAEAAAQLAAARGSLAAAQTELSLHDVVTPIAGTITKVNARVGEAVDASLGLAEVVDLERLEVAAQVPSEQASQVTPGQAVLIEVVGRGGEPLTGSVAWVAPGADPQTGAATVRVRLPSAAAVRPGQFAAVRIVTEERRDRLAAPYESIARDAAAASTIAVVNGNTATQQPVTVGVRDGALVEVAGAGLHEGTLVVSRGAYALPQQTKIHVLTE